MRFRLALSAVSLLAAVAPASACYEPSVPWCAERYGPFDDEFDFDSCRREMESYQSEVEDFTSCLRNEIDEAIARNERAISEYNDAVESFNRRARGY